MYQPNELGKSRHQATSSLHQGDTRGCSELPRHPSATSSLYQGMLQAPTPSLSHKLTLPGDALSSHVIPQPQAHYPRGCSKLPRHPSATSSLYQGDTRRCSKLPRHPSATSSLYQGMLQAPTSPRTLYHRENSSDLIPSATELPPHPFSYRAPPTSSLIYRASTDLIPSATELF